MISFQTTILKETLVRVDGRVNVINSIEWLITIDEDGVVSNHAGISELEYPTDTFIPFAEVYDAQKLEWAFAPHGGIDALVDRLTVIARLKPGEVLEAYGEGTNRFRRILTMEA